jgi:hypothetical protein
VDYHPAVRLKIGPAVVVVLVFGQCQSHVEALRSETFVPISGRMEFGSNFGYTTDVLWFPGPQIWCVVLKGAPDEQPSGQAARWFVHAAHLPSCNLERAEPVQVPASLAARIFALADSGPAADEEARSIAEEGRRAGLFRIDLSEIDRALRFW